MALENWVASLYQSLNRSYGSSLLSSMYARSEKSSFAIVAVVRRLSVLWVVFGRGLLTRWKAWQLSGTYISGTHDGTCK